MHCIGELIDPIAVCPGFRYGASTPCRAAPTACIIRSEPMTIMWSASRSGIVCSPSCPAPYAAMACTMLPTKLRSCGRSALGTKPGASSQHQTMTSAARSISSTL